MKQDAIWLNPGSIWSLSVPSGPYRFYLTTMVSILFLWVRSGPYGIGFADLGFPEALAGYLFGAVGRLIRMQSGSNGML